MKWAGVLLRYRRGRTPPEHKQLVDEQKNGTAYVSKFNQKPSNYGIEKLKRDVTSVEWIQCNSFSLITDVSEIRLRCNHKIDMQCVSYMTCTFDLVSFYICLHRKRTLYADEIYEYVARPFEPWVSWKCNTLLAIK